jgi:glycopeptide antibiotics resistance protein
MGNRNVNLIPFSELILNMVIFVPLGIYAGVLFKGRTFGKYLFVFFLSSLIVEGLQFILRVGIFDITDIITNTLGGIIGLMIFVAIEKVFNNSIKAKIFINIIAAKHHYPITRL